MMPYDLHFGVLPTGVHTLHQVARQYGRSHVEVYVEGDSAEVWGEALTEDCGLMHAVVRVDSLVTARRVVRDIIMRGDLAETVDDPVAAPWAVALTTSDDWSQHVGNVAWFYRRLSLNGRYVDALLDYDEARTYTLYDRGVVVGSINRDLL